MHTHLGRSIFGIFTASVFFVKRNTNRNTQTTQTSVRSTRKEERQERIVSSTLAHAWQAREAKASEIQSGSSHGATRREDCTLVSLHFAAAGVVSADWLGRAPSDAISAFGFCATSSRCSFAYRSL